MSKNEYTLPVQDPRTVDGVPEAIGTDKQRNRVWPPNGTPAFVTFTSRCAHQREDCWQYLGRVADAVKKGRTVWPPEWTSTEDARARGKGLCSACWDE